MKVKLFYSYSHEDEEHRDELAKHLTTLRDDGLIDDWHDREIVAGSNWNQEIEENMANANIILLLFSSDFIGSESCKEEVKRALELKKEKDTIVIPVILRKCAWQAVDGVSEIQALPEDGKPIKTWADKDEAWTSIYAEIKKLVENIRSKIMPTLKSEFKDELLKNPVGNCTLDKLFVYQDILEIARSKQKLEKNEIDSKKLKDIKNFGHKYILIEGDEQIGKTSLCNMLYLHYSGIGFYPIIINGKDITGKVNMREIVSHKYQNQCDSTMDYWSLDKEKMVLLIDDIDEYKTNHNNYVSFIKEIKNNFEHAIIFIDKLSNLSNKSIEHNYFSYFQDYSIRPLNYKKRNNLIKKCISNDENIVFDENNTEQLARLDKDTKHIDTIIGSNIVPSYPVIVISTFNIVELITPQDMSQTSYGHCYHAMITMNLYREGIKPESMNVYFNFLTELSYFIFCKNEKTISYNELENFLGEYKKDYNVERNIIKNLVKASILVDKNMTYSFQYIYIYYYFVARYISAHIDNKPVKQQFENLLSNIHRKDNSNIVIFITHHTKNDALLDDILLNTMSAFEKFPEATLINNETKFIGKEISRLVQIKTTPDNHNVAKARNKRLQAKDKLKPVIEKNEEDMEYEDDSLLIEIRKSAKSMEIIGQIMKNQYGVFKKDRLTELFGEGQNVGLRLLKSFMDLMNENTDDFESLIQSRLLQATDAKGRELSQKERTTISKQFVTIFSYGVIFGWLHKIVDSLGYDKLVDIADIVNDETDTVASKLINFSIHAWHKKLDIGRLKRLYEEFDDDKNYTAIHILKDIVSRHIYMHPINYMNKQKIDSLLGFSVRKQISVQSKIKPNHPNM